jgi:hypothetical protein
MGEIRIHRKDSARRVLLALAVALCAIAPAAAEAARPKAFVGTVSNETYESLGYMYRPGSIDRIAESGVGTLRQTFDWSYLRNGDSLSWDMLDRFIGGAARRGIRILPVLFNPPAHLTTMPSPPPERGFWPTIDPATMGRYGAMLAARYGTNGSFWAAHPNIPRLPVTSWQIWNEPNLEFYWRPTQDVRGYVAMLRSASEQIKAVDPAAEIVSAGLPNSRIATAISPFVYVRRMLRAGAAGSFDTLAVNGYAPTGKRVIKLVRRFRKLLNRNGARKIALRVTEFGWADRGPEVPRNSYTAGPRRQGKFIATALRGLWRARRYLKLKGVVYYSWRDQPVYEGGRPFWGLYTGLTRLDGSPKPALRTFQRTVSKLR